MENFYDRTERLLGSEALSKLRAMHIVILGIGGVGSWACEALARTGVGTLTLVDFDMIEPSNVNRQVHALESTVGRRKVDVMAERLLDINSSIVVYTHDEKLTSEMMPDYVAQGDYTIDCIDDVRAKVALIKWHLEHGKKIVSSMGTGNKIGTHPFKIEDISKTQVCPLARAVRLKLRKEGIAKGVPVLYSEEPPYTQPPEGEKPGTICFCPAMAGLELARYIISDYLKW
ncbi:MAG: tRNA threonylcarbamoyladenosine dehydratase [Peptococcaceae bacterium]|nr:tRNA threonylcarbamoyladenosine dehydratase [Peptococcaceae bacterium]